MYKKQVNPLLPAFPDRPCKSSKTKQIKYTNNANYNPTKISPRKNNKTKNTIKRNQRPFRHPQKQHTQNIDLSINKQTKENKNKQTKQNKTKQKQNKTNNKRQNKQRIKEPPKKISTPRNPPHSPVSKARDVDSRKSDSSGPGSTRRFLAPPPAPSLWVTLRRWPEHPGGRWCVSLLWMGQKENPWGQILV